MTNVHNVTVAVTALLQVISDPGPNYPIICGMNAGHYICHVHYGWSGAYVTVPVVIPSVLVGKQKSREDFSQLAI